MKLLFISDFILAETQGAKYLSQAHYYSLKSIFGQENVDIVALNSSFGCDDIHYVYIEKKVAKICKFTNILMGMPFLLRRKGYKKILYRSYFIELVHICQDETLPAQDIFTGFWYV